MIRSTLRSFACALALAAMCGQAAAQNLSQFPDEQAILAVALESRGVARLGRLLLADKTATFSCSLPRDEIVQLDGCSGMRHPGESVEQVLARLKRTFAVSDALLADLRTKAAKPVWVDKPFDFKAKQTIWGPEQGVKRGLLVTPDLALAFSRPAIDAHRQQAVAYVATISWTDPRRSFGEYILLNKARGKWSVAKRLRVWEMAPPARG